MVQVKRYTVTAALPYANGPIHLGHVAGVHLPADIYVRYLRQKNLEVLFISGSDEHGVPITVRARQEGCTPQCIVDKYHALNQQALEGLQISYDIFARTSSALHYETASQFFEVLHQKGLLHLYQTEQYFDVQYDQFLSDRYVKGLCPYCKGPAYGDQCEPCGAALNVQDLINPISVLSGQEPILKATKHWFLPLDQYETWLKHWILQEHKHFKTHVYQQCKGWLDQGLQPRAVTRDLTWGIPVPLAEGKDKVLYVWFDAPIGYISATKLWAKQQQKDWEPFWKDPQTCLVHFLGKDNIVFHCIIFPVMLKAHGDFILPTQIPANEFLNLEGEKFSTSKNHAVWLHEYLEEFPGKQDVLRYVLCSIMPENKDSDFTWKMFQEKNNNELSANLGNLVNRTLTLAHRYFNGVVPGRVDPLDTAVFKALQESFLKVGSAIETFKFKEALQLCMGYATLGNKYLTEQAPWNLVKHDKQAAGTIVNTVLQLIATLTLLLRPFLPTTSGKMAEVLGLKQVGWDHINVYNLLKAGDQLGEPFLLFEQIDDAIIQKQIDKLNQAKSMHREH